MKVRVSWFLMMLAGALAAVPDDAVAQGAKDYPTKAIRIIVPFAPGGSSDILARSIGQKLSEMWKQPVVVDNRPGADGNVGASIAAKADPDGYTLVLLDTGALTMSPSLYPKLTYDPAKDFAPITMIVFSPHALVVHPSLPVKTVKELIAYDKANPGKLNFGSSSNAIHLAQAQFELLTGIKMLYVPYKGGAASLTALAGGEVNVALNGLLATLPHIKGGRIRGIAVASAKRMPAAPELPTIVESGVPGLRDRNVAGLARTGRHPERHHRQAARRGGPDRDLSGNETAADQSRCRGHCRHPGAVRRISAGRHNEMGQDCEGNRHQGRVKAFDGAGSTTNEIRPAMRS